MPGLVSSSAYSETKASFGEDTRLGEMLEAIEWELMHQEVFTGYPVVAAHSEPVRAHSLPGTLLAPGVVVVFQMKAFPDEVKVVLLGAFTSEGAED